MDDAGTENAQDPPDREVHSPVGTRVIFRSPDGWEVEPVEETLRIAENQILDLEGLDPEAWREIVREHPPVLSLLDVPNQRVVPGATSPDVEHVGRGLRVIYEGSSDEVRAEGDGTFSLLGVVSEDLWLFAEALHGFRLISGPSRRMLAGCRATEYVASYFMVHQHLPEPIPVRERCVYVHADPEIFTIKMYDLPDLDPPLTWDYDPFLETVRVM